MDDDDDSDDEHYDKKSGEALLRDLIAQVLPSFNPRYLNVGGGGGDDEDDDDDDTISNPRLPSPTSHTNSSSNASSIRSTEIDIEINKKSQNNNNVRMRSNIHQEKLNSKRLHPYKTVHTTKTSELRRLQAHSRR